MTLFNYIQQWWQAMQALLTRSKHPSVAPHQQALDEPSPRLTAADRRREALRRKLYLKGGYLPREFKEERSYGGYLKDSDC